MLVCCFFSSYQLNLKALEVIMAIKELFEALASKKEEDDAVAAEKKEKDGGDKKKEDGEKSKNEKGAGEEKKKPDENKKEDEPKKGEQAATEPAKIEKKQSLEDMLLVVDNNGPSDEHLSPRSSFEVEAEMAAKAKKKQAADELTDLFSVCFQYIFCCFVVVFSLYYI